MHQGHPGAVEVVGVVGAVAMGAVAMEAVDL